MMKTLVGALALSLAGPALAQPVPAADPHAGHTPQGQANPAQHGQTSQQHQQHAGHGEHGGSHGEHMKDCCGGDRQDGRTSPCCDKHADTAPEGAAGPSHLGN